MRLRALLASVAFLALGFIPQIGWIARIFGGSCYD